MNVQLRDITVTARDGRVSHLDQVYIRGSHVRFFIVPDMLRYVPTPRGWMDGWRLTKRQERADVPVPYCPRSWCWLGQRKGYG
jgi:hypothetical protein